MWNDHNYNPEELKIVREYEFLLFKYNPGFRAMWHDNFEEYFKGTQSEEYWNKREAEREKKLDKIFEENMKDPEYASWRSELAIIEESIMGDPNESPIARSRWFEREQWMKEFELREARYEQKLENDQLLKLAKSWSMKVMQISGDAYEKNKDLDWFRILQNCLTVSGKIVFASHEPENNWYSEPEDFLWRTDRAGYIMSLASLQRCLESLRVLEQKDSQIKLEKLILDALKIQTGLIDRLDTIEQRYLISKSVKGHP
jgi:hypothetical protein